MLTLYSITREGRNNLNMGIGIFQAKWLWTIKHRYDVDYNSTAVLGRQIFPLVSEKEMKKQLRNIYDVNNLYQEDGYSELLWNALGCSLGSLDVFDNSDYEGANIIHDMNEPVQDIYIGKYSVVIDGGTLEHVFNYQTAIRNVMLMVREGGHLILMTPANQYMGHGFYQFSPQLFFSLLNKKNGYRIEEMLLCESDRSTFRVKKAKRLFDNTYDGVRRNISTRNRADLFVVAKRVGEVPDHFFVQQSDYLVKWEESKDNKKNMGRHNGLTICNFCKKAIIRKAPISVQSLVYQLLEKMKSDFEKPYSIDKEIEHLLNSIRLQEMT